MSRDGRVALPRDALGLSAFFVVFPDHTHLLFFLSLVSMPGLWIKKTTMHVKS